MFNVTGRSINAKKTTTLDHQACEQRPMAAKSIKQMAMEALKIVPSISPVEAQRRLEQDPYTLVIDVRDAADIAVTGTLPGALNISLGALAYQADIEAPEMWRAPELADRSRPIIVTCMLGPLGALGGRLLHEMGFGNVSVLDGGVQAWIAAGLPVTLNESQHRSLVEGGNE